MAKARTRDDGLHDQYCESTPGIQRFLYDEAYRRQAAATGHTEWSKVNPSIFTVCFTEKAKEGKRCDWCLSMTQVNAQGQRGSQAMQSGY